MVKAKSLVFPAGAGVILFISITLTPLLCFPRRCGGDPDGDIDIAPEYLFSPQVRG